MSRYFFDFYDTDAANAIDDLGLDLDTVNDAKRQAAIALADYAADVVLEPEPRDLKIVIRTARGPVAEITLNLRTNDFAAS